MNCPKCNSENIKKNGQIHNGKQNHRCRDCCRQFVEGIEKKTVSDSEKISLKNCRLNAYL